ncbi:hypothetical protein F5Y18DRAFT_427562 [Xylariaceae sp. FL1019]|nr:hypothetical protein F5Y18DRAFT_427562 [Xylariaceae sp. FL1019]
MSPPTPLGLQQNPSSPIPPDTQLPHQRRRRRRPARRLSASPHLVASPSLSSHPVSRPLPLPPSASPPSPVSHPLPDSPPSAQQAPPPKIGHDQKPGNPILGSVEDVIETAVERHLRTHPSITLRDMHKVLVEYPVLQMSGRKICKFYVDECLTYYRDSLTRDDHPSGRAMSTSSAQIDIGPQVPSRSRPRIIPATSTKGSRPSTLDIDDVTNAIEIVVPSGDTKLVTRAMTKGRRSFISPSVITRCELNAADPSNVPVELRWNIEGNDGRGQIFSVPDCSFEIRDGLRTDLVIGQRVREKLDESVGPAVGSYTARSSNEDQAPREPITPVDAEMASCTEVSIASSGGSATSLDFLTTLNRLIELNKGGAGDTLVHGKHLTHRDDTSTAARPSGAGIAPITSGLRRSRTID